MSRAWIRGLAVAAAGVALALIPESADAQWPVGKGEYWAKMSVFSHSTTEQFRADREKRPFLNSNAESHARALFLDGLVGVTDRLDVWLQVPYFELEFNDDVDDRRSTGIGDIRMSARYNLIQLLDGGLPISARFTAKAPIVDFPIDAEVIPVGEGQWDYEAWLEAGVSLWPLPAYSVVWLGHRWRAMNSETTRDPGDEFMFLAELGVTGRVGGKVVLDGIFGGTGAIQGIQVSSDQREILYVQPTLTVQVTPSLIIEAGSRIPMMGRNFPAGRQWTVALFHQSGG